MKIKNKKIKKPRCQRAGQRLAREMGPWSYIFSWSLTCRPIPTRPEIRKFHQSHNLLLNSNGWFRFRINISSQGYVLRLKKSYVLVSILITVGTWHISPRVLLVDSSMFAFLQVSIKFKLDSGDLDHQLFYRKLYVSPMRCAYLYICLDQIEISK